MTTQIILSQTSVKMTIKMTIWLNENFRKIEIIIKPADEPVVVQKISDNKDETYR